jgi:hypothetical protein
MRTTTTTIIGFTFGILIAAGCAHAQPRPGARPSTRARPPPPAPPPPSGDAKPLSQDSSVDDILDALDQRGNQLDDFTADVDLTDTDVANGNDSKLIGQMKMQRCRKATAVSVSSSIRRSSTTKPRPTKPSTCCPRAG